VVLGDAEWLIEAIGDIAEVRARIEGLGAERRRRGARLTVNPAQQETT